jgi:hypothetical protein
VSSGAVADVGPGGVFVVEGAGHQAAVQDADPSVGELSQGDLVAGAAGSDLLVVGLGAR